MRQVQLERRRSGIPLMAKYVVSGPCGHRPPRGLKPSSFLVERRPKGRLFHGDSRPPERWPKSRLFRESWVADPSRLSKGGIPRACPRWDFANFELADGIGARAGAPAPHDANPRKSPHSLDGAAVESHPCAQNFFCECVERAPSPAAFDSHPALESFSSQSARERYHRHSTRPMRKYSSEWCSVEVCPPPKTALEAAPNPYSALFENLRRLAGVSEAGVPGTHGFRVTGWRSGSPLPKS